MTADAALYRLVAQRGGQGFAWGQSDCAIFAFDAVAAVTGHDVVADLRGSYASARGAVRTLRPFGGLAGLALARLGAEVPPADAQAGDVVLVAAQHCTGAGRLLGGLAVWWRGGLVAQAERGLARLHAAPVRCWRPA